MDEIEDKEIYKVLRNIVEELSQRENEIIKLYYGFYNNERYTQKEISVILGMSKSNVSKVLSIALSKISSRLLEMKLFESDEISEMKKMGSDVRSRLLSYLDVRSVYELANTDEMSEELQDRLKNGKRILDTLKQYKYSPRTKEEMINSYAFLEEVRQKEKEREEQKLKKQEETSEELQQEVKEEPVTKEENKEENKKDKKKDNK